MWFQVLLSLPLVWLACCDGFAEDTPRVAGRTLAEHASLLSDADRVVRLRAARSLGSFGVEAGEARIGMLDHEDAAVRYIGAVQLGRLGEEPLKKAKPRLRELASEESSLAVRMAASYALCRSGLVDEHLPLLVDSLKYPERGTACSAAELIGDIGPSAAAAIDPLETAYAKHKPGADGGDYHIGGAAANALRKLRPDQN